MAEYALEKNVAMPTRTPRQAKYPFGSMEVDDSFEFAYSEISRVRAAASIYGKRNDVTFTVRQVDEQTGRCWRVK